MFIRLVTVSGAPGKRSEIAKIADKFTPLVKEQPGNLSCIFIMNDAAGEYGLVTTWTSEEEAVAAKAKIGSQLIPELEDTTVGSVNIKFYEVYEP